MSIWWVPERLGSRENFRPYKYEASQKTILWGCWGWRWLQVHNLIALLTLETWHGAGLGFWPCRSEIGARPWTSRSWKWTCPPSQSYFCSSGIVTVRHLFESSEQINDVNFKFRGRYRCMLEPQVMCERNTLENLSEVIRKFIWYFLKLWIY